MPRYLPPLSLLISVDNLPPSLGFLENGLNTVFSSLYFKDLYSKRSQHRQEVYYNITIVTYEQLDLNLGGDEGFALALNPSFVDGDTSEFPMSVSYSWPLLRHIDVFDIDSFDFSIEAIFNLLLEIASIDDAQLISMVIDTFYPYYSEDENEEPFEKFVNDFNANNNPPTPIVYNVLGSQIEIIEDLITQLSTNGNDYTIFDLVINDYLAIDDDFGTVGKKLERLFSSVFGSFTVDNFQNFLLPKFSASLDNLNIALKFPRTWLKPVDPSTLEVIEDEDIRSMLIYNVGSLYYSSESGFEFNQADSFDLTPSQIGNTGLIIEIDELKFDFRSDRNIPEATADGRPDSFKGIYADKIGITLPKKWFNNVDNTTLQIAGNNMLIGTGGVSGTIAIEAIDGTPNNGLDYMSVNIGNWELGFNHFDITFKQNAIIESNIAGLLKIPKLKDGAGNDAEILINGHLNEEGDFNLIASEPDGIPRTFFDFVTINFLTLELGSENDNFYIGTSCEIWFDNPIMDKLLNGQKISIPRLRVYDNGRMEIVGGNSFIPTNIALNLGPIEIAVTGIHFGSHQQEHGGVMRKYNYWGFDGAISLDPLGIDARGEGIKYYYTVDNDEMAQQHGGDEDNYKHSFLRIQTIEVDLIIPGTASPESAVAIIHGMVSIPEPGVSPEYIGEVSLKLPKAKIAGGAAMRLQPKHPAFLVDAYVDLPAPIPLGPLGIYGFRGLLGFRYVAEKEAVGLVSGEDSWYDYYTYPPKGVHISKFSGPERTEAYDFPFSIGAGAVLGTSFDSGTILSMRMMMLLSMPTMFLLDGKASILSARLGLDDNREPPFFFFTILGDDSLEFGMGADFQLPQNNGWIIDLYAEVQAGFFFNNPQAWYVNFGTRNNPITARILTIVTAQSYLMLSASGIEAGARVEFDIRKRFGPARVRIYAYLEMGGFISFERPQIGGYIALGGMIDINIWIVGVTIGLDALFSVEAAKPFLIYAEIRLRVCVRIIFKVCKSFTVKLKWEKNKQVDRNPIPALPYEDGEYQTDRTKELVQAVHMLTNESFELTHEVNWVKKDQGTTIWEPLHTDINNIIPLDTYIDIKTVKGLIPGAITAKIGGHTGGADNYTDLIPPQRVVRGGREIRQVKHKYSIEDIVIKAWTPNGWMDYHPFEAIVKPEDRDLVDHLRIGYWQRSGDQYDAVRLLATNPFSYTEAGEPGWMIPEQYGITPSELFCAGIRREYDCSNVLNKVLGTIYYPPTQYTGHYINGAYFTLEGFYATTVTINPDGTQTITISEDNFRVSDAPNNFDFAKSLEFDNGNSLIIILEEPSVEVKLKLTTFAPGVTISYYKSNGIENYNPVYEEIHQEYKTASQLQEEVIYVNETDYIAKVVINPDELNQGLNPIPLKEKTVSKLETEVAPAIDTSGPVSEPKEVAILDIKGDTPTISKESVPLDESQTKGSKGNDDCAGESFNVLLNREIDYGIGNSINIPKQELLVNDSDTLSSLYKNFQLGNTPKVDFNSSSIIFISFGKQTESTLALAKLNKICHNNNKLSLNIYRTHPPESPPPREGVFGEFLVVEIAKVLEAEIELNVFNKFYNHIHNIYTISDKDERFCDMYYTLQLALTGCINEQKPSDDYFVFQHCFDAFINAIKVYDMAYSDIDLISLLQPAYNDLILYPTTARPPLLSGALVFANAILDILKELGDCCCNDTGTTGRYTTSLQEICWMTLENYEFNLTIPGQDAVEQEQQDMVDAIQKTVQPIWRPNTKYYVRFRLKDEVDNGENEGLFDYYYGFKTVGPVGHYHKHPSVDYVPTDANPDQYPLTSLRQYIDYNRSYPNADGSLLLSKPLFYGHDQCKITIYFSKPLAYHMLNKWYTYNDMPELPGSMHIAIKDPITEAVVPYPLPADYDEETVPTGQTFATWLEFDSTEELDNLPDSVTVLDSSNQEIGLYSILKWEYLHVSNKYHVRIDDDAVLSENPSLVGGKIQWTDNGTTIEFEITAIGVEDATWNVDNDPRIPVHLQLLNNMIDYINANSDAIECELTLGDPIVPNSYAYSITLTNLKPRKLYTALLYNAFDVNSNSSLEETESEEVHQFVFQTSRYQNFEEQVNSYWLRELDTEGTILNERQAVFEIPLSLSTAEIDTAYNIVEGISDPDSDALEQQYYNLFDRATEGVLGFNPVDPSENTEFNLLKDTNTDKIIGILIRNPEPFNIPKIPLEDIEESIAVVFATSGNVNNAYKVLYSKDYSQALIMHSSKEITADTLNFRFQYKTWNGSEYEITDTVIVENILITQ